MSFTHVPMPKKSSQEGLVKTVAFRVTPEDAEAIAAAMHKERRTESDVCRALLGRGIAAYRRDGQIFEPELGKIRVQLPVPKTLKTR
jgi:hypothetical protein